MTREIATSEKLRVTLTEDELSDASKQMASEYQRQVEAREERKSVMADFTERIERHATNVARLSRDINNGWVLRDVDCVIYLNRPKPGVKRLVRTDTGEVVREEAMSNAERQEPLFGDSKTEGTR